VTSGDSRPVGHPAVHAHRPSAREGGGPLSPGTVTDGLRKITPLFEPDVQALRERQIGEKLFYGDETRWEVFAALAGEVGHR
jgi:hypothetical protein